MIGTARVRSGVVRRARSPLGKASPLKGRLRAVVVVVVFVVVETWLLGPLEKGFRSKR